MKKVFFVIVLVLVSVAVFGQELVYTSEGDFLAGIQYKGQYQGQFLANLNNSISGNVSVKLSNGQLECVRKMLNKYNTTIGDTYEISFFHIRIDGTPGRDWFVVTCEFTSNTQYSYWAFRRVRQFQEY